MELFHTRDAYLVEGFEDVLRCKEESSAAAGWVQDGYLLHGMIEMFHQEMVGSMKEQVVSKLANVEIVSDEVIDFMYLALRNLTDQLFASLQSLYGFSPYLGRQIKWFGRALVPVASTYQELRLAGIYSLCYLGWYARESIS